MPKEEDFLQHILASPDDDTPRRIFADWLMERGDPRGDFIQVQCRLAALSDDAPDWVALKRRERELLAQHKKQWSQGRVTGVREWGFRRGFIEDVRLTGADFLSQAGSLFANHPIRRVRIDTNPKFIPRLAACPALARLRGLAVGQHLGNAVVRALGASPHLGNLTSLELGNNGITSPGIQILKSAPFWPRLTHLDLTGNHRLGLRGIVTLLGKPEPAALTELHLVRTNLGEVSAVQLARWPRLAQITSLELGFNHIFPRGVRALADSPHVKGLTTLDLQANTIGVGGVRALTDSPHLGRLRRLDLSRNSLNAEAARLLAASPLLGQLTRLHLRETSLGSEGVKALAASPGVARLVVLDLAGNHIGNEGALALVGSKHLGRLWELDLRDNRSIDEDARRALRGRFGDSVLL